MADGGAIPWGALIGAGASIASGLAAPRPNAYTDQSSPQNLMDEYTQQLRSEFGRQHGQATQGVNLPDATVEPGPTMTGGVLPFPIGDVSKGLGGGSISDVGTFGDYKAPAPNLDLTRPTPGGAAPGGSIHPESVRSSNPDPNAVQPPVVGAPKVNRVLPTGQQGGSSNEDAQAALRMLGKSYGF